MRAPSGLNKLVGFGLSMALLAIAALVAIPAMIRSSGENAWGAIALGQNLGAFGAMLIAYGWGSSAPLRSPKEIRRVAPWSFWPRSK